MTQSTVLAPSASFEPARASPRPLVLRVLAATALMLACTMAVAMLGQLTESVFGGRDRHAPFDLAARKFALSALLRESRSQDAPAGTGAGSRQQLVEQDIPGSGNGSVVPIEDPPDYCTIKGTVWSMLPRKFFCAVPAHRTDTCETCDGPEHCLSPEAALLNLEAANASLPFKGWNPQGGGEYNDRQSVTIRLPGSGEVIRSILWANAGDVEHDPEWIKVWSSYDGSFFQLRDVLNVTALRGNSDLTVLPLEGDVSNWGALPLMESSDIAVHATKGLPGNLNTRSQTRAKYWRINPGGIKYQSIPRSVGLCPTVDCTNCGQPRSMFTWASEQQGSTFAQWRAAEASQAAAQTTPGAAANATEGAPASGAGTSDADASGASGADSR